MVGFSIRGSEALVSEEQLALARGATKMHSGFYPGRELKTLPPVDKAQFYANFQVLIAELPPALRAVFAQGELFGRVLAVLQGSTDLEVLYRGSAAQSELVTFFGEPVAPTAGVVAAGLSDKDGRIVDAVHEAADKQRDALSLLEAAFLTLYAQALEQANLVQAELLAYQKGQRELADLPLSHAEGKRTAERHNGLADKRIKTLQKTADELTSWLVVAQSFFTTASRQVEVTIFEATSVGPTRLGAPGGMVM
jgi:hypothetical protein